MKRVTNFIAIPRQHDGTYDLEQEVDGVTLYDIIEQRLWDCRPGTVNEFGRAVARGVWMTMFDDAFIFKHRANIDIRDERGFTRPIDHILLDMVELAQKHADPVRTHWLMRRLIGSDSLSDRFIGAAVSCNMIIKRVPQFPGAVAVIYHDRHGRYHSLTHDFLHRHGLPVSGRLYQEQERDRLEAAIEQEWPLEEGEPA